MRKGANRFCILALLLAASLSACKHLQTSSPEIVGSLRFSNQVYQAVLLLKARDPDAYAVVTNYVGLIREGPRSGMRADNKPPVYEMTAATAFYSLTWCAATIAHDSFHAKLYREYREAHHGRVPGEVWTGNKAEQQCMTHQLAVMERIGSTRAEIDYAKTQADGHYVKDHETWSDYRSRKW